MTALNEILSLRLHQQDISRLIKSAKREEMFKAAISPQKRIAYNALWILTHLPANQNGWLETKRNELINLLLTETHTGKKRLLLTLLNRMPMTRTDVRTDYLDFCLSKINSTEQYAVRSLALKQAYAMARLFPELLHELRAEMELMNTAPLSPGLRCSLRNITRKLADESNAMTE